MANPKLATTDYVDGEVAKKQGYFADVTVNETTGNRELSLKDATDNVVGQIIAQKEGGVLFKDLATPTEATDGANKGYADDNFANALKGSKIGSAILIDDVSPVTHEMSVKISSDTVTDLTAVKVSRCGKNLIQFPYIPLTTEKTVAGITYTPLPDGGIKLNGTATTISSAVFYSNASQGAIPITLKANLTYMASTGLISNIGVYIRPFKPSGNSHIAIADVYTTRTITLNEDTTIDQILVVVASGTTVNNVVVYPQIELGSAATGYELYDGQTYTPTADGTVENVKSIYPTTTLMTDTAGVIIDAEYNRDINKAFAALEAAIATNNS